MRTTRTIKGKDYRLAGYMTFDEYWNSDAYKSFNQDAVLRRDGPEAGLKTRYTIWEPIR